VDGYGTPVGPDLSRPPPIYWPVGKPPRTRMNVLKPMIGLRLLDDKDYLSDEMSIADLR
jgi:hypothetical protein